ncbi:type II secretion system GspH family protein [Oceanimonas baumannii]|uniref:pilus assembly FimT family protein n=1 Tax=Oceanimonas baumannii TaxID=129578 RepID=UPI001D1837F9|nr:type II secretion system protein [Oceanimonas baumannii]MCC4264599.1 type II secretion system GspH family protein [Oceanimonas baumannii]
MSRQKGFTLIELLVVMALLAVMAAVVVPGLWGQYTRFNEQQQVERFWQDLSAFIRAERRQGNNVTLHEHTPVLAHAAEKYGLTAVLKVPIMFRSDGMVSGGEISLITAKSRHWVVSVIMPDGDVLIEKR